MSHPGGVVAVALADDESLVRAGVRTVLEASGRIEVVAEAADGRELLAHLDAVHPDVVLTDARMPVLDGIGVLRSLHGHPVPVVVLTTFADVALIDSAVDAGASGYLLKTSSPDELVAGVLAAAAGGACFSPRVAARVLERARRPNRGSDDAARARARVELLPPRLGPVLVLVAKGLGNAEIARTLHLSEHTVKGYVSDLLDALGVGNRVAAAVVGFHAGLLDEL